MTKPKDGTGVIIRDLSWFIVDYCIDCYFGPFKRKKNLVVMGNFVLQGHNAIVFDYYAGLQARKPVGRMVLV